MCRSTEEKASVWLAAAGFEWWRFHRCTTASASSYFLYSASSFRVNLEDEVEQSLNDSKSSWWSIKWSDIMTIKLEHLNKCKYSLDETRSLLLTILWHQTRGSPQPTRAAPKEWECHVSICINTVSACIHSISEWKDKTHLWNECNLRYQLRHSEEIGVHFTQPNLSVLFGSIFKAM